LKRIYEAIENGMVDMGDQSLKDRIGELTAIRDQARDDAERTAAHIERVAPAITRKSLGEFARVARRKLRRGGGTFARDHLRSVAQRVEVMSRREVRIIRQQTELLGPWARRPA
jgi:hypothetical protein